MPVIYDGGEAKHLRTSSFITVRTRYLAIHKPARPGGAGQVKVNRSKIHVLFDTVIHYEQYLCARG